MENTFKRTDFDMLLALIKGLDRKAGEDLLALLERAVPGDPAKVSRNFKPDLFLVLAESYALAEKLAEAEAVYGQWAREYPNDPRVYKHLADLLAQEAKYKEAYEALREEVDLKPEVEQEPAYRVALALGPIAAERLDLDRLSRQILGNQPEIKKLLGLLFLDLWPTYGTMGSQAREAWLDAACLTYYLPSLVPASTAQLTQTGAEKFAKAVEIELRQSVFDSFRNETSKNVTLRAIAGQSRTDQIAGPLARFLVGNGKLALGQMKFILTQAKEGKSELFMCFGEWTNQHFPNLGGPQLEVLRKIYIPRNLESHEQVSLDVKDVPRLCREFLNALLARVP